MAEAARTSEICSRTEDAVYCSTPQAPSDAQAWDRSELFCSNSRFLALASLISNRRVVDFNGCFMIANITGDVDLSLAISRFQNLIFVHPCWMN